MAVPAGWYPDGQGNQRWWDGAAWTSHIGPLDVALEPWSGTDTEDDVVPFDIPLLEPETDERTFTLGPLDSHRPAAAPDMPVPDLEPEHHGAVKAPARSIPLAPVQPRKLAPVAPKAAPAPESAATTDEQGSFDGGDQGTSTRAGGDASAAGKGKPGLRSGVRSRAFIVSVVALALVGLAAAGWLIYSRATAPGASSASKAVVSLLEASANGDCDKAARFSLDLTPQEAGLCFPEVQSTGVMYQVVSEEPSDQGRTVTVLASGGLLGAEGLDLSYVAVKSDGRWFVDLAARSESSNGEGQTDAAGQPGGETTDAVSPSAQAREGFATPELAVTSFIDAAWVDGDCSAAYKAIDPGLAADEAAFCATFAAEGGLGGAATGTASAADPATVAGEYATVTGYVVQGSSRTPFSFELVNQGEGWLIYYVTAAP